MRPTWRRGEGRQLLELRAHTVWGLIARGTASVDYAQTLLQHDYEADAREDGAAILAAVRQRH